MPAYNEGNRIAKNIEETARTFNDLGYNWELIIMDDGSTDQTYENASALTAKYSGRLIVVKNSQNLGKGSVLKQSLDYIKGDYTLFLDADMDLHPRQTPTLFEVMFLHYADVVIGSKLHPHSTVNYPLQRRIISLGYYLLVRMLFNLPCHDTQTGLKLFKTEVLRKVFPRILVKQFAFDLEVLVNAHHLGYRIVEAPIVLNPQRRYSRITTGQIYVTLWDTLAVFYRMYILKYYDRIDYYRSKGLAA